MRYNHFFILLSLGFSLLLFTSCSKDDTTNSPKLIIKLDVDSTQVRLGNTGNPATVPVGNAAQHPAFNSIACHYLELAPNALTALGSGTILYHAPETEAGGSRAIDFSRSIIRKPGEVYLEIPLKDINPGSYEWVRLSLSYQNYDVKFYFNDQPFTGTIASFVGYNNYIGTFRIKNQNLTVNANKLQGFWGAETPGGVVSGDGTPGATTVVNPIFATSPIPQGSCVVTGKFNNNLVITGNETENIIVKMSLSVNNSFEWQDSNGNGRWDVNTGSVEPVVDMGLRGLIPMIE